MAWHFISPLAWVTRPALLPIASGAIGLFYGSYDITVTLGQFCGAKHHSQCSFGKKVATFATGLVAAAASVYARVQIDPPPSIPRLDVNYFQGKNFIGRWILQSKHAIITFPYLWYASSVAAAGVVTGVTVSVTR